MGRAIRKHQTLALVLRRTPFGEADWIVSLFTEELGQVSALAKFARKSKRRFGGGLEPLHTLNVRLDEPADRDLLRLQEAELHQPRASLLHWLGGMEAAGQLLAWLRHASLPHSPDAALWSFAENGLNALAHAAEQPSTERPAASLILGAYGLYLLSVCGWGLELDQCVHSGIPCPPKRAAMIDPRRGGLVSRASGGGPLSIDGAQRERFRDAQQGHPSALEPGDETLALALVNGCLRAHAGIQ